MNKVLATARRAVTASPWLTAAALVVAAGGSVGGYMMASDSSDPAAQTSTSRLVTVSTGTVSKSVSASGTLQPAADKNVSFSSSARITSVRVAVGDRVRKGQILGTIDNLSLKSDLASARSTLATARATLAAAESSAESTDAQLAADRVGVHTARAGVKSAENALADATLRSPISGVVAEVNVQKGDISAGNSSGDGSDGSSDSSSSSSSTSDFEVIGTKKWQVSLTVDDTEIGLVKKGQQAQITTGGTSKTIFGVVSSVSVLSSADSSSSAAYPVTVDVTGSQSGLHDGADATVSIIYRQVSNVLTVPAAAIHLDTDGSSYVYVDDNGKKVKTKVTTGLSSGTTTEIKSGLSEGQQVYIEISTPSGGGSSDQRNGGFVVPSGANVQFPGGGSVQFPGGVVKAPGGGS